MAHTCSATDRQFIRVAELNMVALGDWGQNYREGEATAKEVVGEAEKAAARVSHPAERSVAEKDEDARDRRLQRVRPRDGREVEEARRGPCTCIARTVSRNFAHDVLVAAAPELQRRGCDVSSLL